MKNTFLTCCSLIFLLITAAGALSEEPKDKFGDFVLHSQKKGSVVFRHKDHESRKNIPCDYCHAKIKKMKTEAGGKDGFSYMKFCITCHDGKISFQTDGNCSRCHETRSAQTLAPGERRRDGKDMTDTTANKGKYHEM